MAAEGLAVSAMPTLTLNATVVELGDKTDSGHIIAAVHDPFYGIVELILRNPEIAYRLTPRQFEEVIAGAWER
jgi:hypothetical protein